MKKFLVLMLAILLALNLSACIKIDDPTDEKVNVESGSSELNTEVKKLHNEIEKLSDLLESIQDTEPEKDQQEPVEQESEPQQNQISLYSKGLELINNLDKLAECNEYISLYSNSPEIYELTKIAANGDYSKPKLVFSLDNATNLLYNTTVQGRQFPSDVQKMLEPKLVSALPALINGIHSSAAVATATILTHEDSFIYEGLQESASYIYTFNTGYSFIVSFTNSSDNIVNASATAVINDELKNFNTPDELSLYLRNNLSIAGATVSVITE